MIVVTTPTGRIGAQVVQALLQAGEAVRVIVRDAAKLAPGMRDRIDVIEGSHADRDVVVQGCQGADRYFLLMPPSFTTTDSLAYFMSFANPLIDAIGTGAVRRVVAVSNCGRGAPLQAGVVSAALAKDEAIERTGVAFRALWCPGFYENLLQQAGTIRRQGAIFMPGAPDLKTRFCATRDIAAQAVKLLLDRSWTGQGGLGVLGTEDLSWNDIAAITAEELGMPVRFQRVSYDDYRAQFIRHGASPEFAAELIDMLVAKDQGLDNVEARTAQNTTPTSFRAWCRTTLKPAVLAA